MLHCQACWSGIHVHRSSIQQLRINMLACLILPYSELLPVKHGCGMDLQKSYSQQLQQKQQVYIQDLQPGYVQEQGDVNSSYLPEEEQWMFGPNMSNIANNNISDQFADSSRTTSVGMGPRTRSCETLIPKQLCLQASEFLASKQVRVVPDQESTQSPLLRAEVGQHGQMQPSQN